MSRARFGLLAVLLLAIVPLAAAQVPGIPTPPSSPTAPPSVTPPGSTLPPVGEDLAIEEGPLTFLGPASNPDFIAIQGADGATVLSYTVDADGRARLDVAGENAVTDATFVRIEGDPTGDAFRLVLRDAQGGEHAVDVDRVALTSQVEVPPAPDTPLSKLPPAPIEIARPPTWPGAPQQAYLLAVEDGAGNRLPASKLDGASFLQKSGNHHAQLQIPLADNEWDRWFLTASRVGQYSALNATFVASHQTENAMILDAAFAPSLLAPAEGDRVGFTITYEKRLSPLVVQRFVEDEGYKFRVDGGAPSAYVSAPPNAQDFRFPVTWGGADTLSGLGYFRIESRVSGASQWTHWVTTPLTSAVFQGDWGKTYEFRARAYDRVGNPSSEALAATSVATQPEGEDDVNDPPTVRFLAPLNGAQVEDVVAISWLAEDPDDSRLVVRLELSDDEGETYRLLYAGTGSSATWDTLSEADGPGYKLRITVSDGTQSVSDSVGGLSVRNIVVPAPPSGGSPQTPAVPSSAPQTPGSTAAQPGTTSGGDEPVTPAGDDGDEPDGKDTPLPMVVLVGALGIAALATRRRKP